MTHPTQSSRAERLAEIRERLDSGVRRVEDVEWLLSKLEAADATAADFRDRAALAQANADVEHAENIDLRLALEEAKLALRPFAKVGDILNAYPEDDRPGDQNEFDDWHQTTFGDCRRAAEVAAKREKL